MSERLAQDGRTFPRLGISVEDIQRFSASIASWKERVQINDNQANRILSYGNCSASSCHAGTRRDWIGPNFTMVVSTFVTLGVMPPDSPLSSQEGDMLVSALRDVYFAKLIAHFSEPMQWAQARD